MKLVKQTASHLIAVHKPWLIIKLIAASGAKYMGFGWVSITKACLRVLRRPAV